MKPTLLALLITAGLCLLGPRVGGGETTTTSPAPSRLAERIPPRPAGAATGGELARRTAGMPGPERQRLLVAELLRGNVPERLRHLVPVRLRHTPAEGDPIQAVVWVMPDYLAIGADDDFLRMPLTWPSATAVAAAFDLVPPTRRIVDAIYAQAPYHLVPEPLPPGPRMRSSEYYLRHRELIRNQRAGIPPDALIAGHKKDVVLSRRLVAHPDRIAIYGWHRPGGEPIQPLSTVHGERYADYSHGLRLVHPVVWVDGRELSIFDVLADPHLAPLLSDEGPIPEARQLIEPGDTPSPGKPRPATPRRGASARR